jgi:hypothetical protein
MIKVAGYAQKTFVHQGVATAPATGGGTTIYSGSAANAAQFRMVKNAAQTGGATPIAYYTYSGENPTSANGIPLYDGDFVEIYENELSTIKIASADANTCTIHYILWFLK